MAKFEVDFSEALRQLAAFQAQSREMGAALDKLQAKAGKPADAAGKLIRDMHKYYSDLEDKLIKLTGQNEGVGKQLQNSRYLAQALFGSMAAANLKLTVAAQAYNGELKELERLLKDSAAKQSFIKWAQKSASLQGELTGQNKHLTAQIKALGTEEGRTNLIRKASLSSQSKQLVAAHQMALANKELKQQVELLGSMYGKSNAVLRARIAETVKVFQEETKLAGKLAETQRATDSLTSGIRRQIVQQTELNKGIEQSITFQQREQNAVNELIRRQASLNGGLAEQAALLKANNQAREKEITDEIRQQAKLAELERQYRSLNGGLGEHIVRVQQAIRARTQQLQGDSKAGDALRELTKEEALSQAASERSTSALKAKNAVSVELARSVHQMTVAEARNKAQAEALAAATKRHSDALLEEARAAYGMSKAQKELNAERERAAGKLARLKAQRDLAASDDGRAITALKQQIAEQERYNKQLAKSTLELLGFSNAQRRATMSLHAGSQSAAMLRAGLSGLQTSIGMYTSATILMASATYATAAAMRSAVVTGAEFTATMSRANAVMNSTSEAWQPSGMEAMEAQVRALGATTSYTASEVAAGLVELGQAGLSTTDALLALKPALNLALIGNITMAESSDIATNVMMMFHKEAEDLTNIVDIMAVAASRSNTNISQLSNALTYAGPAAQSANISLEQTTAAIAALSNNGIKASRAGTALRRLFVSIVNPTKKGADVLDKYGVSVKDAEGKTKSLIDIIKQLNKNIPEVDRLAAVQDLVGVYATSPIVALVAKPEEMEKQLRYLETVSNAAEEMRRKIEDNLKFDWKQVTSSFEELKLTVFDDFEWLLRYTSKSMTAWMNELKMPALAFDATGAQIDLPKLDASQITGSVDSNGVWQANVESVRAYQDALAKTAEIAENSSNTVYTHLDKLVQEVKAVGTAAAMAAAGFLAFKVAGGAGGVFYALQMDSKAVATNINILRDRMIAAGTAGIPLRMSLAAASAQMSVFRMQAGLVAGSLVSVVTRQSLATTGMRLFTGATAMAASAMNAFTLQNTRAALLAVFTGGVNLLSLAFKGLAVTLQGVAIAGRVAMAALGWAGLIFGLYSAWQAYKEMNAPDQLAAEAEKAKQLEEGYRSLSEAVEQYGYARENVALKKQISSDMKNIAEIGSRRLTLQDKEREARGRGLDVDFSAEYAYLDAEEKRYGKSIQASNDAMSKRLLTMSDIRDLSDQQVMKAEEIKAAEEAQKKITWDVYNNADKYHEALQKSKDEITELNRELDVMRGKSQQAAVSLLSAAGRLAQFRKDQQNTLDGNWFDKNATTSEKYAKLAQQLKEQEAKTAALMPAPGQVAGGDFEASVAKETEYKKEMQDLIPELAKEARERVQVEIDFSLLGKGDAERLAVLSQQLAAVRAEEASFLTNGAAPDPQSAQGSAYLEARKRTLQVETEIDSLKKSMVKTGEKAAKQTDRELEQARQAFEQLQKKFDPVGAANDALKKAKDELSLLRGKGDITTAQEEQALIYLRNEHKKAIDEQLESYTKLRMDQDKNYRSLAELQEAYSDSDSALVKHAKEMAELNRLYDDGAVGLMEYTRLKQKINESGRAAVLDGLPQASMPSDNTLSTPFSDSLSIHLERAQGLQTFSERGDQLDDSWHSGYGVINDQFAQDKAALDALLKNEGDEQAHQERLTAIQADAQRERDKLNKKYNSDTALLADQRAQYEEQMGKVVMSSMLGTAQNLLSSYASIGENATAAQKVAFAAMKALAVAQIVINTELAVSQLLSDPTIPVFGMKMAASTAIRAAGYASAGLVAGMAVAQMAGGGSSGSSGSSYSGAYDDGGFIPYNSYGIVGEYGPEIVHGPANVTSRKESAKQLNGGTGEINVTLSPQITVTAGNNEGGGQPSASDMQGIAAAVKNAVISSMQEQMRPNGVLDTWIRSKRG